MSTASVQDDGLLLAPMWRRAVAGATDTGAGVLLASLLVFVGVIDVSFWQTPVEGLLPLEALGLRLVQDPAGLLRLAFWVALPLSSWHGLWGLTSRGTPGERLARLAVIERSGHRAGVLRRVTRGAAYVLAGPLLGLPLLFPWISRTQRGLPDLLARTWVVDARCVAARAVLARRGPSLPTGSRPA